MRELCSTGRRARHHSLDLVDGCAGIAARGEHRLQVHTRRIEGILEIAESRRCTRPGGPPGKYPRDKEQRCEILTSTSFEDPALQFAEKYRSGPPDLKLQGLQGRGIDGTQEADTALVCKYMRTWPSSLDVEGEVKQS